MKDDQNKGIESERETMRRNTPKIQSNIDLKDIVQMEDFLFPEERKQGVPKKTKLSKRWDDVQAAPRRERIEKKHPACNLDDILMSQAQMRSC